ncbi:hypothetical protein M514_05117 [Trichuris suis]|uniref:Uncharacterized protein n=1 Tax=Trichuris suis TaxID=68888 RepID=A0A085MA52_9BILA|nr:hypothetical protein M513_05117 [Trichuris suis]KFD63019.1 hypothetical protein M514_05117 [Trichuris suis]
MRNLHFPVDSRQKQNVVSGRVMRPFGRVILRSLSTIKALTVGPHQSRELFLGGTGLGYAVEALPQRQPTWLHVEPNLDSSRLMHTWLVLHQSNLHIAILRGGVHRGWQDSCAEDGNRGFLRFAQ